MKKKNIAELRGRLRKMMKIKEKNKHKKQGEEEKEG